MTRTRTGPAVVLSALVCMALVIAIGPRPHALSHAQTTKVTAESVARQIQDRDTGRDSRSTMRMKLFDRHGRVRERALTSSRCAGRGQPGAPATAPDGDRLLIRFTYPNDIRGTGFLVWEHPTSDDERFLYLPSLGRVRRIAGTETQESFVGSDFTYEDIGGREFDDYTYALLDRRRERVVDGARRRRRHARPGGSSRAARTPPPSSRASSRSCSRTRFVVVQAEIYNRRNEKQKVYTVRRLEQIEGDLDGDGVGDDQRAREDAHRARRSRRSTTTSG